jgi:hypothetical protein
MAVTSDDAVVYALPAGSMVTCVAAIVVLFTVPSTRTPAPAVIALADVAAEVPLEAFS